MRKFVNILLISIFVHQAYSFSISIDNPSLHVETDKASRTSQTVQITNNNPFPVKLKIYAQDWLYTSARAKKFLPAGTSSSSCSSWLGFPKELTIPAQAKKECPIQIDTPRDAVGGHQAVVFFETAVPASANALSYSARLGTIIYQQTKGNTQKELTIIKKEAYGTGNKINYAATFKNTGNAWNSASGTVVLVSGEEVIDKKDFGPLPLLPGEQTDLRNSFEQARGNYVLLTVEGEDHLAVTQKLEISGVSQKETAINEKVTELSRQLPTANLVETSAVNLKQYSAVYDKTKKELSVFILVTANSEERINASVKVFSVQYGKRVKTVDFNEKMLRPGQLEKMSVIWPIWDTLPPGKYNCVLNLKYADKVISAQKEIQIPKK